MASYQNFQIDDKKYENSANIFKRKRKTRRKQKELTSDFMKNFKKWTAYYRENPHRFAVEYLGLKMLTWWQQFILYKMWHTKNTIFLASRGLGKSWITCLYFCCMAILYPGIKIRVAAANVNQAKLLIAKIHELKKYSPNLEREIAKIQEGKEKSSIEFKSGSVVSTVVASPNARGERAQIVIVDEREQVDKSIISEVFLPFLSEARRPPYMNKPEYKDRKDLIEPYHFVQMSSIGSKTSSLYVEFLEYLKFIAKDDDEYCTFSLPYQFGVEGGMIVPSLIEKMVKEGTQSLTSFKQEFEVIPTGDKESSVLSYDRMNNMRKLRSALYPPTDDEFIECEGNLKKFRYYTPKMENEIRVLSMDVGMMRGRDNSAFVLFSLTPSGMEYIKELRYIETINGMNTEPQVLRFKQLFYDLECDYAVLDCANAGQSIFDILTKKTIDIIRNRKYPAWKSRNNDEMNTRVLDIDAEPVLYTMKVAGAGAGDMNTKMVNKSRIWLELKTMMLLQREENVISYLDKKYKYKSLVSSPDSSDNERATRLIAPYAQTSKLVEESISAQVKQNPSGGLKIVDNNKKSDRLMSMLYNIFFIDLLEQDIGQVEQESSMQKIMEAVVNSPSDFSRKGRSFGGFSGFRGRGI